MAKSLPVVSVLWLALASLGLLDASRSTTSALDEAPLTGAQMIQISELKGKDASEHTEKDASEHNVKDTSKNGVVDELMAFLAKCVNEKEREDHGDGFVSDECFTLNRLLTGFAAGFA